MSASLSGVFNLQSFTDLGALMAGGRLYTYAPSTTTQKTAYTDAAGSVAHTYTNDGLGGQYVALNSRGELPAPLFLTSGGYDITLKTSAGVTVWTRRAIGGDDAGVAAVALVRSDLASTSDATKGPGLIQYTDSLAFAVGTLGRRIRDLGLVVNVPAGGADATAAINAKVLQAFQSMANVLTSNEVYSVYVDLEQGKDYSVLGTILLPNGVVLRGNGSRLIGADASAGSTAYSSGGAHMIRSARWDGAAIVSNAAAVDETTWRVIGMGVENLTFINVNCPIDLTNCQDQCFLDGLRFSNVSAPMRLKSCFYLSVGAFVKCIVRTSALAAAQPAVLLWGAAAHAMQFNMQIVGAAIGYECTATNSFSVSIDGSIEEGYAINSIGIRANNSYCQSWKVHAYIEGVRIGFTTAGTGAFFACNFSPAYFSSCEYAMLALTSSFRSCTLDCASIPDEGVGIRNLVDLQAANNDVRVRMPSKTRNTSQGVQPFPTNYLLGPGCVCEAASAWVQNSNAQTMLGLGDGALVNKSSIVQLPYEGRQVVTVSGEVPFCTLSVVVAGGAGGSITLDSLIVADNSDVVLVNLTVQDFNSTYLFHGFVFGTVCYWLSTPGKTMTVSSNAGFKRFVVGSLNTTSYAVQGVIRHP